MAKVRDKQARSYAENILIRDYFENKKNGYFVEVGANDPINHGSQSWHLETNLNWSGVLVEPISELAEKCRRSRPNAKTYECACVGENAPDSLSLFIPYDNYSNDEIHSRAAIGKNIDGSKFKKHKEIKVQARTLNSILAEERVESIDLLSIDVEGAELEVLLGFSLNKYKPSLILLEDKHLYLDKHRYLKRRGYKLVKRTRQNCWYVPINAKRPPQSLFEKIRLLKRMYISIWSKKLAFSIRHKTLQPLKQL
jgi:FkbM family methyltransferase